MFTLVAVFCSVDAHLLGDRHEQIGEDFEQDRIGFGAGCSRHLAFAQCA